MNKPKVSVVIPTYNRPEFLVRALLSVYCQTFDDYEVIVIDDGNNPSAKDELSKFLRKKNFMYLETKKNQGAPVARNIGIRHAKGEYVAFLDDDDEWLPHKLDVQVSEMEKATNDVGFSFTGVINNDGGSTFKTQVKNGIHDFSLISLHNFKGFLTVTQMVRKTVLNEVGGFDETLSSHQDPELIIRITRKYKGLGINQALTYVHIGKNRDHIGGNIHKRIQGRLKLLQKHEALYEGHTAILARNYFQVSLWYRDNGSFSEALKYMKKTFFLHPLPKYFFHIIFLYFKKI